MISPQWLVQTLQKQNKNSSFHVFPYGCLFLLNDHVVPLPYHPASNLPVFQLLSPLSDQVSQDPTTDTAMFSPMATHLLHRFEVIHQSLSDTLPFCTTADEQANLTAAQLRLYDWHVRLGHMNFATIQSMAQKNLGIPRDLACCQPPLPRMPVQQSKMTLYQRSMLYQ